MGNSKTLIKHITRLPLQGAGGSKRANATADHHSMRGKYYMRDSMEIRTITGSHRKVGYFLIGGRLYHYCI